MIEYKVYSVYDGLVLGSFPSFASFKRRANFAFKYFNFDLRRRYWDVYKFKNNALVNRFTYACHYASKNS